MNKKNLNDYRLEKYLDVNDVKPLKNYQSLELFAGAGGLALGLEWAGFNNIGCVEIDKNAAKTLKINRPKWTVVNKDINQVAKDGLDKYINNLGGIDLITGGIPCQSFSYAGKGMGMADTRGTLFHPMSLIIKKQKPKMFVLENVKGLVSHDKGKTLKTIIDTFEDVGYKIKWNILNSWDYDTAQKRERIFIVGIREDIFKKQKQQYAFPEKQNYRPVLKDILKNVPKSEGKKYPDKKYNVIKLVPPGGCWIDLPEDIAKEYMQKSYYLAGGKRGMARRMKWDEPSLTLTTAPDMKQTERCHPDETRPFTVREYARIQSFPDDWVFSGGVTNQYKQIGNAVPVTLAKYMGLSIVKYLNQFYEY